jgi:acyl dehydratase
MTESFDHRRHGFGEPRFFEDLAIGERFYIPSRTMTQAHFAAFQTISADNHPIHHDVEYCRELGHESPSRTASRFWLSPQREPAPSPIKWAAH